MAAWMTGGMLDRYLGSVRPLLIKLERRRRSLTRKAILGGVFLYLAHRSLSFLRFLLIPLEAGVGDESLCSTSMEEREPADLLAIELSAYGFKQRQTKGQSHWRMANEGKALDNEGLEGSVAIKSGQVRLSHQEE